MSNEKILIVEDEGIVAMHIENNLKNLGYTICDIVSSGEDAIEMVKKHYPDLVLMDIVLKGRIDGIEAAEHIQKNFNIPVIYLTAYGDESTLHRAKITEPFGYLLKPFKERELHIAIEIALYKHGIEARLRTIDRFLTSILKYIEDAIIITDVDSKITYMNSIAGSLTGWDTEEAINRNLNEVLHMDRNSHPEHENIAIRIIQDDTNIVLDPGIKILSKQGNEFFIEGKVAPMKDEKGVTDGVIIFFRNITLRKKSDDALRKRILELEQQSKLD